MSRFPLQTPGGFIVHMTDHAIARYRERVRPHLDDDLAVYRDAQRLVNVCGMLETETPAWAGCLDGSEPEMWLVCGDVAFVCALDRRRPGVMVALTVVTRGGISDEARQARNRKRSARTWARRKGRHLQPVSQRTPRARPALEAE